eukprot:scaffold18187_cov109-Isochrysis_galbana.AAC.1
MGEVAHGEGVWGGRGECDGAGWRTRGGGVGKYEVRAWSRVLAASGRRWLFSRTPVALFWREPAIV